ncbi:MAG: hypothetical protein R8G60_06680 [Roseovarius pacificus]|nr:hypothetical protein [Roseovarius pacificus]
MLRFIALLAAGLMLAACTNPNDLDEKPASPGDFHLQATTWWSRRT